MQKYCNTYKCRIYQIVTKPVFLAMLSSSSGYFVSLCISIGMMSFSCSLRHWGLLSASWDLNTRLHQCLKTMITGLHCVCFTLCLITRMKELKRGSFFCLLLIWSKAYDWWLQNLAVSFWNHSPSGPSNLRKQTHIQISETLSHNGLYNCVTLGKTTFGIIFNYFVFKHWQHPKNK